MESAYYVIENHLPIYTWPLLIIIFIISLGVCVWRGKQNKMSRKRAALISLLITYVVAILFTTLIFRTPAAEPKAEFIPFWSWYEVIVNHSEFLFNEILLNVMLFVPVGVLVTLLFKFNSYTAFFIGFIFSGIIETTQYFTCRGLFEWDDMIHNGLGCLLGYGIGKVILKVWSSRWQKSQQRESHHHK